MAEPSPYGESTGPNGGVVGGGSSGGGGPQPGTQPAYITIIPVEYPRRPFSGQPDFQFRYRAFHQ